MSKIVDVPSTTTFVQVWLSVITTIFAAAVWRDMAFEQTRVANTSQRMLCVCMPHYTSTRGSANTQRCSVYRTRNKCPTDLPCHVQSPSPHLPPPRIFAETCSRRTSNATTSFCAHSASVPRRLIAYPLVSWLTPFCMQGDALEHNKHLAGTLVFPLLSL